MPVWTYTNTEVSEAKADESVKAIKSACFGCKEHSNDCPIYKATVAVSKMTE